MAKNTKRIKTGEIIHDLRVSNGYRQQQVADAIGISRSLYSKYETVVVPPYHRILKLSAFYGVSCDHIMGNIGNTGSGTGGYNDLPKETRSRLTFASPKAYGNPANLANDEYENNYMYHELSEDVRILVDAYMRADDAKRKAILLFATKE